jgi:hypothetical protein
MEKEWYYAWKIFPNVSREELNYGQNLWWGLRSDPKVYGEKGKDGQFWLGLKLPHIN